MSPMSPSEQLFCMVAIFFVGAALGMGLRRYKGYIIFSLKRHGQSGTSSERLARDLIQAFFGCVPLESLIATTREYPIRIRADLQRALDELLDRDAGLKHFCAVHKRYAYEGIRFSGLIAPDDYPAVVASPEYEEVDIGEPQPVRCLHNGLWLLEKNGIRYAAFMESSQRPGHCSADLRFFLVTPNGGPGTTLAQDLLRKLEQAMCQARSYRGKILSLDVDHNYTGRATGLIVHKLRKVQRSEVILPERVLELLDRNVIRFAAQRQRLLHHGQSARKGLLFYGPPGTGKTHTIHYLAGALDGHTMLLITAEQVGLLPEYMTVARLLQPSVVVIEDVDLIGRQRTTMHSACEEVVLNKLLNEMDGLKEDAEILFLLTTNHPESLETALTSRPERIDQAIEFPIPDESGRDKLVRLYSQGIELADGIVESIVRRTEGASGAFIKELMRRATQFNLERNGGGMVSLGDIENALDEILVAGGSLNLRLLGNKMQRDDQEGG